MIVTYSSRCARHCTGPGLTRWSGRSRVFDGWRVAQAGRASVMVLLCLGHSRQDRSCRGVTSTCRSRHHAAVYRRSHVLQPHAPVRLSRLYRVRSADVRGARAHPRAARSRVPGAKARSRPSTISLRDRDRPRRDRVGPRVSISIRGGPGGCSGDVGTRPATGSEMT